MKSIHRSLALVLAMMLMLMLTVLPVFAEETGNAITVIFDLNTTPDLTDNETYVYTTTGYDEYWQPVETQSEAVFTTEDGVLAVDLPIPTREGWYFAGWQTKPDVTESDLINGVSPYLWIPGHKTNFLGQALQAQDETTGMENTVVQLTVSFLTVAVYVGIRQGFVIRVPIEAWPWIIVLGIVNTGIGCYLYFSPLSKLPVQTVAICGYLEPLSAVVFASLLLGEKMTALQIIGAACIIGGAMIGELLGKKE